MNDKELSVVFLMWLPFGSKYFKSFLKSYKTYVSNADHDFVILFNGCEDGTDLSEYFDILSQAGVSYSYLTNERGQDIWAYRFAAERIQSKYLLFFNTYSEILGENWARSYLSAIKRKDVGMVSASGSWQSKASWGFQRIRWIFSSTEEIEKNVSFYSEKKIVIRGISLTIPARLSLLLAFIKSLRDVFSFPFFPNPHLRTNGFIIERNFWLGLEFNDLTTKRDAYKMESGRNSFTRQILKRGKRAVIVDKFGEIFEIPEWNNSLTSWSGNQENLLNSDNFTGLYENIDELNRIPLAKSVWGTSLKYPQSRK